MTRKLLTMAVLCFAGVNLLCGASAKMSQDLKTAGTGNMKVIVQYASATGTANPALLGVVGTTVNDTTAIVTRIVGLGGL